MSAQAVVRAMLVSGGARVVNVAILTLRTKAVALLLGPEGIGLMGLMAALQEIGAQVADAGLSHSAVREVAVARAAPWRIDRLRRALALGAALAGLAGMVAFWLFRRDIAILVTGDPTNALEIGLLGLGVLLTVLFRWQQALLCGYNRVGAVARLATAATALATVGGIGAVWLAGRDGLVWAVLLMPAAGVLAAPIFTRQLPRCRAAVLRLRPLLAEWRSLWALGSVLMLSALVTLASPLVIRVWLVEAEGLAAAGLYQAAWVVSMHVMTVALAALAADFLPRLSAASGDPAEATWLVNQQTHLHLALGAPVAVGVLALAPWLLQLLFAAEFAAAAGLLQWLMVALVLRLAAAPVEAILTARARPLLILPALVVQHGLTLGLVWAYLPDGGLEVIGAAAAAGQLAHLVVTTALARRLGGFRWQPATLLRLGAAVALALGLIAAATVQIATAPVLGIGAALLLALAGAGTLRGLRARPVTPR